MSIYVRFGTHDRARNRAECYLFSIPGRALDPVAVGGSCALMPGCGWHAFPALRLLSNWTHTRPRCPSSNCRPIGPGAHESPIGCCHLSGPRFTLSCAAGEIPPPTNARFLFLASSICVNSVATRRRATHGNAEFLCRVKVMSFGLTRWRTPRLLTTGQSLQWTCSRPRSSSFAVTETRYCVFPASPRNAISKLPFKSLQSGPSARRVSLPWHRSTSPGEWFAKKTWRP
jgi:hypothetical protein